MKFPKTYVDRNQHAHQVVVANEQQEAELPSNFVPLDGSPSGATGASPGVPNDEDKTVVADASGAANTITAGLADLEERRAAFDKATDEFSAHVRDQNEELTNLRAQLDAEADKLANERKILGALTVVLLFETGG